MKSLFLTFFCLLFSAQVFAQPIKTFMPENDLDKQDSFFNANGMTEELFNQIIDEVEKYYSPIVSALGGDLYVERNWDDATVNAYASQEGSTWKVAMFGGLARRNEITPDGFAMVVCHELGHHVAGWPYVQSWAANEGQSDYFAMQACAKNLWKNQDAENAEAANNVDPYAKKLCDTYSKQDINLCYRSMSAGYSLATLLGALNNQKVNFQTPDKAIVKTTYNQHPKAQCRLDTYVAGTLCAMTWNDNLIPKNAKESAKYLCTSSDTTNYPITARPRCWFKP
jgi:hypothetical protein